MRRHRSAYRSLLGNASLFSAAEEQSVQKNRTEKPEEHNQEENKPTEDQSKANRQNVRDVLYENLMSLDFKAFEHLIRYLLIVMGYENVLMARGHWKGRTSRGGRDLELHTQTGLTKALIVVQLKHYRRPVQRRFIDELRGVMLRTGARQGLLIATSTFPQGAREAAASDRTAPLRLIDGDELLDLHFAYQVGVYRVGEAHEQAHEQADEPSWILDKELFVRLDKAFPKQSRPKHQPNIINENKNEGNNANENIAFHNRLSHNQSSGRVPGWLQNGWTHDNIARYSSRVQAQTHVQAQPTGDQVTWRTHILAGLSSLWLLTLFPDGITPHNITAVTAGAAMGALLPDLDAAESKLKHLRMIGIQPFAPLSTVLSRTLGHRGLLHSLIGYIAVATATMLLVPWLSWQSPLALLLGYGSHLVADAATRSGIPWLYPNKQRYHLLPRPLRFVTGSHAELLLFPFLALLASVLLLRIAMLLFSGHWEN